MENDTTALGFHRKLTGWWWTPLAVFWWGLKRLFILVIAVVALANFWRWIDPPEPLRLSKGTTLITEPIAADGYPDFRAAMLDRMGRGISPEKNGAIEFWQGVGPAPVDPEAREAFFAEIGMAVPPEDTGLEPADEQPWAVQFSNLVRPQAEAAEFEIDDDELANKLISQLLRRPTSHGNTVVQDWANRNGASLDRLIASTEKPGFYSPPIQFVLGEDVSFLESRSPHLEVLRDAATGIGLRAMTRLRAGDSENAWRDAMAMAIMGRRNAQIPNALNGLAGAAVLQTAFAAMPAIFSMTKGDDSEHLLESIVETLAKLPEPAWTEPAIAFGEPLILLDEMIRAVSPSRSRGDFDLSANVNNLELNVLFGELRHWQIRSAEIAAIPDRLDREEKFQELRDELWAASLMTPWKGVSSFFSRDARSRNIAIIWSQLMLSSQELMYASEDRTCAQQRLTLLAAALKLHQLRHGEYPETLDALTPDTLTEIPLDPFTNKPFVYERRDEGFAIWSLGRNGVDDNGSDLSGEFVDGDYAPIDWTGERPRPNGPDDVVVRLPVPALELPGAAN